jgi:hypothetical protein
MVNDGATRSSAAFHSERDFVEDVWEEAQCDETQWELAEIIPLEAECLIYLQIKMEPCTLRLTLIEAAAPLILRASENFWRSELGHNFNPVLTLNLSKANDKDRILIRVIATNITSRSGPRMLAIVTRPISCSTPNATALQGRILILQICPPGSDRKIAAINCWMPHSG